jgi:hypothetical protein
MRLHPDRNPTADAASRFADVYDAYTTLRRQPTSGRGGGANGATGTATAAASRPPRPAPRSGTAYGRSDPMSGRACSVLVY